MVIRPADRARLKIELGAPPRDVKRVRRTSLHNSEAVAVMLKWALAVVEVSELLGVSVVSDLHAGVGLVAIRALLHNLSMLYIINILLERLDGDLLLQGAGVVLAVHLRALLQLRRMLADYVAGAVVHVFRRRVALVGHSLYFDHDFALFVHAILLLQVLEGRGVLLPQLDVKAHQLAEGES